MMTQSLEEEIRAILAKELEMDPSEIHDELSVENMPAWDSMRHVGVVFAIEDRFGIELSQEETEEMYSFKEIVELLSKKLSH